MKKLFFLLFVVVLALVGCSEQPATQEIKPPRLKAELDGQRQVQMKLGTYSWSENGKSVTADAASPYQIGEEMRGNVIPPREEYSFIKFREMDIVKKITVYEWKTDQRGNEVKINEKLEIPLQKEVGRHVYEAFVEYEQGEASFTFVIETKEDHKKEERN